MTPVDRALLRAEWIQFEDGGFITHECPSCPAKRTDGKHEQDCAHDLALCERGYPDQISRDRARAMLSQASDPTIPPPPQEKA